MKAKTVVCLDFPSEAQLKIVFKALEPETRVSLTRSRAQIKSEGKRLELSFEATDTSALRATVNSYLRWIALINDTCSVLKSIEKE